MAPGLSGKAAAVSPEPLGVAEFPARAHLSTDAHGALLTVPTAPESRSERSEDSARHPRAVSKKGHHGVRVLVLGRQPREGDAHCRSGDSEGIRLETESLALEATHAVSLGAWLLGSWGGGEGAGTEGMARGPRRVLVARGRFQGEGRGVWSCVSGSLRRSSRQLWGGPLYPAG